MAIESPRIAGQPSVERSRVFNMPVRIVDASPGQEYRYIDESGQVVTTTFEPQFEGQVYFNVLRSGANRIAAAYVAVNISGALQWKSLVSTDYVNGYTGLPFDPMYD